MFNDGRGYTGQQKWDTLGSDFNAMEFFVKQMLSRVATATIVRVMGVVNSGSDIPAGFVDVLPLVNQIDGLGNSVPHGIVYGCPYFRVIGGSNAIIIDPQVGDLGIAIFADHDISSVSATKAQANPGSRRRFDMSDAMYIGGLFGATPTQFVSMNTDGISITSPTKITLIAPIIEMDASTSCTVNTSTFTVNGTTILNGPLEQGTGGAGGGAMMLGPLNVTKDVVAAGISTSTHVHSDPQGGNTGPPI